MKKIILLSAVAVVGVLVACGSGGTAGDAGTGGGTATGGGTGTGGGAGTNYDSATKISAYLDGKTMTMKGADIPSHPNGYNQNLSLGASTQCYFEVAISSLASNFTVATKRGVFTPPDAGIVGSCNTAVDGNNPTSFTSTAVLIQNVQGNGTCFDINITFNGFSQEGRGSISADGKTVTLELFFGGQAAKHRCADGAVGATGVTLTVGGNTSAFTGNAKQIYRIP